MIEVESTDGRSTPSSRRAVVAATVAALIAGTGGFLMGRSTDDPSGGVGATPSSIGGSVAEAQTTAPAVTESAPPETAAAAGVDVASPFQPSAVYGGAFEEPVQQLLAERTTQSGVTLRAHLTPYPDVAFPVFGGPPGWKPAGWCNPIGNLRISIDAPASVNLAGGGWYAELHDHLSINTFASGYAEGSPLFGAAVQVEPDVTMVTMATATGLTDATAPVAGLALLEVDGPIEQDVVFTLTRADGSTSEHRLADSAMAFNNSEYYHACNPPPPALPAAGEHPADPDAAESAIRDSWRSVHDFAGDVAQRLRYLDDDTGVADAWKALNEGEYAEAAKSSTIDIAELVFTSPTDAWFRYDVVTPITNFYDRYGQARLDSDGVWVFTRRTICQDVALAPGFGCTPSVETLLPPSAQDDPRYNPALIDESTVGD